MAEQAYFAQFQQPPFTPSPHAPSLSNFNQLALSQRWRPGSKKYQRQKQTYMSVLATAHISSIEGGGTAAEKLVGLQGLCRELGLEPVPETITRCRKILKTVNVCIVHLIDHRRLGIPIHVFGSHAELQKHIKEEKHYFPKDQAKGKGNSLLRVLLRTINE